MTPERHSPYSAYPREFRIKVTHDIRVAVMKAYCRALEQSAEAVRKDAHG